LTYVAIHPLSVSGTMYPALEQNNRKIT